MKNQQCFVHFFNFSMHYRVLNMERKTTTSLQPKVRKHQVWTWCINKHFVCFKCYLFIQSSYRSDLLVPRNLLFISKRAYNCADNHTGSKASYKQHFNLVSCHAIAVIQGIYMGSLQPVTRCNHNNEIDHDQ